MPKQSNTNKQAPDKQELAKQVLLKHPNLWRAGQLADPHIQRGISTQYPALDEQLPGKGWPGGGLVEFMLATAGIGELRLLTPALKTLSDQENRWIAWVNPPFIPYAPALQAMQIDLSKILLIRPRRHKDALWALERASRSGTCSAVLAWLDEKKLKLKDTQRLQIAAKQGNTLACLFRPQTAQTQSSMSELRLALRANNPGQVHVDILKRRGGWPLHDLPIQVTETKASNLNPAELKKQLDIWRAIQHQHADYAANKQTTDEQAAGEQIILTDPIVRLAQQTVSTTTQPKAPLH